MHSGVFYALLTSLSWAICIFPFTQAARKLGSNALNHFRLVLAGIFIAAICLLTAPDEFLRTFSSGYKSAWLWLSVSGIVGLMLGDYFAFTMYSILGARRGSVLTTFAPAAALILGAILVDEHISIIGITGIAITIAGVNFISLGRREREKIPDHGHGSISKGIIAGILSSVCQGLGIVLAKKAMLTGVPLTPFPATFMRVAPAFASLFLFSLLSGNLASVIKPVIENRLNGIPFAIAGTIFGPTLGVSLSLYSVQLLDPSVAQTIFSLVPAFALLLSALFLKDKITLRSLAGLVTALAGVLILVWREELLGLFAY